MWSPGVPPVLRLQTCSAADAALLHRAVKALGGNMVALRIPIGTSGILRGICKLSAPIVWIGYAWGSESPVFEGFCPVS